MLLKVLQIINREGGLAVSASDLWSSGHRSLISVRNFCAFQQTGTWQRSQLGAVSFPPLVRTIALGGGVPTEVRNEGLPLIREKLATWPSAKYKRIEKGFTCSPL